MKRVLVITYYWPPTGGSGVQRWVKFAKYLPSEGWQPVIYTPSNPERQSVDETLLADIPPEAEIITRKITEPYGLYRRLMGKGSTTDMKTLTSGGGKSIKGRLSLWLRSNLFIPDPRVWWVNPSVGFLKKYLKEHPVDVIITTGPPQSMHLIGLRLHKETGLPWISDFRDPWTRMYWFKKMGLSARSERLHYQMEKEVLDSSSAVLTVTTMVRDLYKGLTSTRVEMITNGYDEEDFEGPVEGDGHFNITHTGIFPGDGNPEVLWDVLQRKAASDPEFAEALRIRLVGKTDAGIYSSLGSHGLSSKIIDLGYQPHNVAVREQRAASVLILPLRDDPDYRMILPGKLFEYVASCRPVLGIGQEDGAMAELVKETGAGTVCNWDNREAVSAFIDGCWEKYKAGTLDGTARGYERYSRRNLTKVLADLLNAVADK